MGEKEEQSRKRRRRRRRRSKGTNVKERVRIKDEDVKTADEGHEAERRGEERRGLVSWLDGGGLAFRSPGYVYFTPAWRHERLSLNESYETRGAAKN